MGAGGGTVQKIYGLVDTKEQDKADLYIRGGCGVLGSPVPLGEKRDFLTYFNGFSVGKWRRYTTLEQVEIRLEIEGRFLFSLAALSPEGERPIFQAEIGSGTFCHGVSLSEGSGEILGFSLVCLEAGSRVLSGAYYGAFSHWREIRVGVSICTFKREDFVRRTIAALRTFREEHSWLEILVVDNGGTLPEGEEDGFRVAANRNYGGSSGFTRGMMEYVARGSVEYVLLMDDDIVLEPSALERSRSLLCGLKEAYRESFLGGAMLSLERPQVQWENSAYWDKSRLRLFGREWNWGRTFGLHLVGNCSIGRGWDLGHKGKLLLNDKPSQGEGRYGGWWFCLIPLSRIEAVGYPLPMFVKGDDVEYAIRNDRPLLTMNGIGVWHMAFAAKANALVAYYTERNMFILSHYLPACGRGTLVAAVMGRLIKHAWHVRCRTFYGFYLALRDHNATFSEITAVGADEKMRQVQAALQEGRNTFSLWRLAKEIVKALWQYDDIHQRYLAFRREKLRDSRFWKAYLGLKDDGEKRL